MNENTVIKNGKVIDPATGRSGELDIRIVAGKIEKVGAKIDADKGDHIVDASGCWVTPGFIDIHTHLRDLGQSDKEDISTGSKAAAAGGYTTVLAMANTDPPTDNALILGKVLDLIRQKACMEVLPVVCVTKGMAGVELTNMVELAQMGAAAFSDDGMPVTNLAVLRRALEHSALAGKIIISHPEDKDLSCNGVINESVSAVKLGLPGIPPAAESACIAREIEVVRQTGIPLHFAHTSTAASVELVRNAKRAGLPVTADVTPHHLMLTDSHITEFDSNYKMNPPLRTDKDIQALVEGLKDGTMDAIATDHAPHTKYEKLRTMDQAPFGVIGLETCFSLMHEKLVASKHLTLETLIALLTVNPAKVIRIAQPAIKEGERANLTVIDPSLTWTYDALAGCSKSINSPFHNRKMTTKVILTLFQGKPAYYDSEQAGKRFASLKSAHPSAKETVGSHR